MLIGISGKIGSGKDTVGEIIQYLICLKLNALAPHQFSFKDFVKSTASNEIQSGFKIKKYADKLKDFVCMLIGCTREQLEDQGFKNKDLPEEWDKFAFYRENTRKPLRIYSSREEAEKDVQIFKGGKVEILKMTPRLLLQIIGTECIRDKVHPNAWVNALFADYKSNGITEKYLASRGQLVLENNYPNWIITDMRFPNEMQAVKDRGGITIRVNRVTFREQTTEFGKLSTIVQPEVDKLLGIEEHPSETALDNAEFDYTIENNSSIEDLVHTVSLILKREKII